MKTLKLLCALACLTCIDVSSAAATTVLAMNLKDLTSHAELIFSGTVTDIRTERQANTIYTYVMFSDLEIVKGINTGATITVRLSGGSVAGETVEVVGMPKFVSGERSIVFLAGNFKYLCPIVGWEQGRFKIKWDSVSGREVLFDSGDVSVTEISGNQIIKARRERPARGSPGVPDSGPVAHLDLQQQREERKPLSLHDFISAVKTNMGIRRSP